MYSRVRSRPVVKSYLTGFTGSYDPEKPPVFTHNTTIEVEYRKETMSDNPTPGFKKASAEGKIINTPMRRDIISVVRSPLPLVLETKKSPQTAFRRDLQLPSDPGVTTLEESRWVSSVLADMTTQALTEARAATNNSVASTLVSLGELGETMRMVAGPLHALRNRAEAWQKLCNTWARANRSSIYASERGLTAAANAWMTWRYGIMPLVYDIQSIIKASKSKDSRGRETFRGKTADTSESDSQTASAILWWGDQYVDNLHVVERLSVRAGVLQDRNDGPSMKWGAHWTNVPGMLYELATLSFVLDWVTNTGTYVESLAYLARGNTLAEWVSIQYESIRTNVLEFRCQGNSEGAFASSNPTGAYISCSSRTKIRYPASGVGSGIVLSINMNWKRWLDAAALTKAFLGPLVSTSFNDAVEKQLRNNPSHRPMGRKK